MKKNDEKKENTENDKKDKILEQKNDVNSGQVHESPTIDEFESNSNEKDGIESDLSPKWLKYNNEIVSIRVPMGYSGNTLTIDNLAHQPLLGKKYGEISFLKNGLGNSPGIISPIIGFEGKAFDSSFVKSFSVEASPTIDHQFKLQEEIDKLRFEYNNKLKEVSSLKEDSKVKIEKIKELENDRQELLNKENLSHLISRVNEAARKKLFESEEFKNLFEMGNTCQVVVMSIDIRRSTEMMLKAKTESLYAEFITSLCQELCQIILLNYGVFDKFTGDGILAFFPDFYSGPDAIYYALKAAEDCHEEFCQHYKESRRCFLAVLNDVGLGIGIDYGKAYLADVNKDYKMVELLMLEP